VSLTLRVRTEPEGISGRMVRRIFGAKRVDTTEGWKICIRSFIICPSHQTSDQIMENEMGQVWESTYKVLVGRRKKNHQ
jgi:hypothetical protein